MASPTTTPDYEALRFRLLPQEREPIIEAERGLALKG